MIRTNLKMDLILSGFNKTQKFNEFSELINIIYPTFIELDGCILIQNIDRIKEKIDIDLILKQFGDRTDFEAFESHVHMIDVSNFLQKNPLEGLKFAKKIVEIWAMKLKLDFPIYKFAIILCFDGTDTIVRFHRIRDNEPLWLDIDNINESQDSAIMIKVVE